MRIPFVILQVKVIPRASRNRVQADGSRLKVYVTAPAQENKANKALIKLLADHFRVSRSAVEILKGARAPVKIVQIPG